MGTGIYPLSEPSAYHRASAIATSKTFTVRPTIANSCRKLGESGLNYHLGDLLYIVNISSVREVVDHLRFGGQLCRYEASHTQLNILHAKWMKEMMTSVEVGST